MHVDWDNCWLVCDGGAGEAYVFKRQEILQLCRVAFKKKGWLICLKVALFVHLSHSHNKQSMNNIAGNHGFVWSWICAHGGSIDNLRASMLLYSKDMIIPR